ATRAPALPDRWIAEPVRDPHSGAGNGGGHDPVAPRGYRAGDVRDRHHYAIGAMAYPTAMARRTAGVPARTGARPLDRAGARHRDEEGASPYTRLPISALVEAAGALYHDPRVRLIFATTGEPAGPEPLVRRSPEIMHGLNNLIQNAVQFAHREVSVTTHWDK